MAQQQFYLRNRGTRALRQRDGWVTTRGSRQRGPPCARAVTRVTDDVSSSKRARESRTQPRIDDGRGSSDGGDPARCAGGLVHLKHLGGRREWASSKAARTSAFVGPIFWRFVQVSLACLENCLSLGINIAARPPSFSKTPHMARCSLIFRAAFPLAVELSCTLSLKCVINSLRAAFHRNVSKTKCNSVLPASRQRPASGSTRPCARLN